eukprot:SAG22_NODE_3340_length_1769_cov_1.898802_2_plen_181_part_00
MPVYIIKSPHGQPLQRYTVPRDWHVVCSCFSRTVACGDEACGYQPEDYDLCWSCLGDKKREEGRRAEARRAQERQDAAYSAGTAADGEATAVACLVTSVALYCAACMLESGLLKIFGLPLVLLSALRLLNGPEPAAVHGGGEEQARRSRHRQQEADRRRRQQQEAADRAEARLLADRQAE